MASLSSNMSESMSASEVIEESATDVLGESANVWFPECDDSKKPFVGQIFNDLVKAVKFYRKYAKACGFVSRKSTKSVSNDGTIRIQYMLCNREGAAPNADELLLADDYFPKKKRKRSSCKVGCEAKIIFQIMSYGRYYVRIFVEGHNHKMVSAGTRHLLPSNRNIEPIHQYFIHAGIKANFGPMRTFRMYVELVGGFDKAGCTSIDFKNYVRDLNVHIVDSDAHMLLDTLKNKKEDCEGFQYFYDVDDENQLSRLIWTDQQSVNNYKNFGEAVSFDATYCTNRYKLIFTPFTGRDNHGKCVSFGAAIISREDMDSYAWVLKKFTECVGKAPRVFMTDQDPGLKKAVAHVWPDTHHRFCMWHITIKVAEKLPPNLRDDSEFKTKFGKIVWSDLNEPADFEENWMNLMNEYELNDNRWFSDMYADRSLWIPAYFRDISMSGLFRTTSMSESENSYFKRFLGKKSNLSVFYMNYNTALDSQRHTSKKLDLADEIGVPPMCTIHAIEKHASTLYTNSIFKEVQAEMKVAALSCIMSKMEGNKYVVDDNIDGLFTVTHDTVTDYFRCTCNLFTRKGYLCSHIFYVLRTLKVVEIPEKYIANRWCKSYMLSTFQATDKMTCPTRNLPIGNDALFKVFSNCIGHVNGDEELRKQLLADFIDVENKFKKLGKQNPMANSKAAMFNEFYGATPPDVPTVLPPAISKTKGSGAGGRRKSNMEKAITLSQKPLRNCKRCNTMAHHDSRNCPTKAQPK